MSDDLLQNARQQASKARPSLRASALMRIARAESTTNAAQARTSLQEALAIICDLPSPNHEHQFEEARAVAAAVDPALLAEIPADSFGMHPQHSTFQIVQVMLAHGHVYPAFDYVLSYEGSDSFPFAIIGDVLQSLDLKLPDLADRRLRLLRAAAETWRQRSSDEGVFGRDSFVQLFGRFWKEIPPEEAIQIMRTIVAKVIEEPDTPTSSSFGDEVHFSSSRQNALFLMLHVLRSYDPALCDALIDSHLELAAAARRYPNGLQTLDEEAEAEVTRRKIEGATCGGGVILMGDLKDLPRQRKLVDATRDGDFGPSMENALEKYREDTSPEAPNYAPKEYWPSTGAFRTLFYQAGKRLGPDAARLLEQVPDDDLRLFASIELAAGLAGVPASTISSRKQRHAIGSPESRDGRIIASWSSCEPRGEAAVGPSMRSPDGRLIRCPKCSFQPPTDARWLCKCDHVWNTFWTSGICPGCKFQWESTACPRCHESSAHKAWYVAES